MPKKTRPLKSGDKVRRIDSDVPSVWVITMIYEEGTADIILKDTNLERFRYPLAKLELVESLEDSLHKRR